MKTSCRFTSFITTILLIAVIVLAGCQSAETPAAPVSAPEQPTEQAPVEPTSAPPPAEPTTAAPSEKITVWIGEGNVAYYQEIADAYTTEKGVAVEIVPYTGLLANDKLALDGPAGKGPDVIQMGESGLGKAVEQGLFLALPKDEMDLESFNPGVVQGYMYKGELYGMPIGQETPALIYNKKLLPEVPEKFRDFIAKVEELNDPANQQYGFLMDTTNFYFVYPFMCAYGGYIFKSTDAGLDVEDIGIANEGAVKGVEFVKSLHTSGLIPTDMGFDVMDKMFLEGKVAAIFNGPWAVGNYIAAGMDIGIAPIPMLDNGEYPPTFSGSWGLAVSAFSEKQDLAIDFIRYAMNEENLMEFYRFSKKLPPRLALLEEQEIKDDAIVNGFAAQIIHSGTIPNIPEMEQVWGPAIEGLTAIMKQDTPVADTLTTAVQKIQEGITMMKQ